MIDNPTSLLSESHNIPFLIEKWDEYNAEIRKIQMKITQLESRMSENSEDSEIVIVLIRGALLKSTSKNKFNITLSQPFKSTMPEELAEQELTWNPTVIIDSTQYPPVFKQTPKGKEKKFTFSSTDDTIAQFKPVKYQEKSKSSKKQELDPFRLQVAVKISNTPKASSKSFKFEASDSKNSMLKKLNYQLSLNRPRIDSMVKSKNDSTGNEYMLMHKTKEQLAAMNRHLKWNEPFVIKFHPQAQDKLKMFTVSINEHFKDWSKVIGSERTFKLDQFDPSKIYDLKVDIKKNFIEDSDATLAMKVQYIKNLNKQLRHAIEGLATQKNHFYSLLKFSIDKIKYLRSNSGLVDESDQNGGWYHNDDIPPANKSVSHRYLYVQNILFL